MEDLGFGIGVLLAVLGPLLILPIVWIVYRFVARPILVFLFRSRISEEGLRWASLVTAVLLVTAALAVSYIPGKWEFDRICSEHATPRIADRVEVEGFFRTRLFAYEAHRFLESFSFVEAPDPYQEQLTLRYLRGGDQVRSVEVTARKSRYGVHHRFTEMPFGITMSAKEIYELSTSRELARAAHVHDDGGPLSLLLGVYGMSSCPDIRSEEGWLISRPITIWRT
jgi:hypothetical protein